jgi:hypothetical protein
MNNDSRLKQGGIMSRRAFLKSLTALVGGLALPAIASASNRGGTWKTLQTTPLAGFQYHNGETLGPYHSVRPEPVEGPQQLTREADNRFDNRAVRVDWQDHKLGYIPRLDNAAVSQLLDRGETLEAAIAELENSSNPWNRVKVVVRWRV